MSAASRISGALSGHRWLAAAYAGAPGVLLLLNGQGHAQLRQQGRLALFDALQEHLAARQLEPPCEWRVLDAAPALMDPAIIAQLISSPRPRALTALAEQEIDGQWKLTLRLPLELVHFDDHFRNAPVLAGVVQVNFALALASPRLGTSLHCREMEALKFQRLLRPGDQLELSLRYEDEPGDERGKLHFAYHLGGEHCSSGRLRVAKHA
jgi:3-hydroxymyristoyl/3-hydroxydecanoyl-(acyl carrier protein) dehydratase